ncbi:MAG: hypothetical protein E7514_07220 [Ruminococcaceae bacterium]|nr:hypothetical protein [Oscillospiraceae bacterium]
MAMLDFLKNKLITGRGATAIYVLLKANIQNAEIVLPANICYAAIHPVVFSGNKPVFCDVDSASGNMTLETLRRAVNGKTSAVIMPHMYGNPVADTEKIARFCKEKGIMLIEDCASSMGAELNGRMLGTFGDYAIFSTGYSKTLDLGDGGILASGHSLDKETELYASLDLYDGGAEVTSAEFSKLYRAFRNSKTDIRDSEFYAVCHGDVRKNFLYRLTPEAEKNIGERVASELDGAIHQRRREALLYASLTEFGGSIKPYDYLDGAVPWRFNIYVAPEVRDEFVRRLLEMNVPVSDWYPVSAIMFDDYSSYPNALAAEKSILNFPLLIGEKRIKEICECINKVKDVSDNGVN